MKNIITNIWEQKLIVSPYCRVSTDKNDQVNSLKSQIKYYTDLIKQRPNWILGEIYYDEGISGTSIKKRKNFNRLIDDALAGKVQFIITKEVSRFARNTVDTLVFTRKLKTHGIGVYFALDNINTLDSDGELRLTIMASIAQEESRKTSERVRWGQRRRMESGVVFGHDLLGYEVKDGCMTIKPDEAEVVKLIFQMFLDGAGCHTLARELRASGHKSKNATYWNPTTIHRILRNEKYVGDLCQRKTYTADFLTHDRQRNLDENDKVYIKNHHDAIIDRNIWNKVQAELARRSPNNELKTKFSNRYWCSGKLFCGVCGKSFVKRSKKLKTGGNIKVWRCYKGAANGRKKIDRTGLEVGCDSFAVNEAVLIECVKKSIEFVGLNKELIIKEFISEIKSVQNNSDFIDIKQLENKISELNDLKSKAINFALQELISNDDLKRQNNYYDNEIANIATQIAEAKASNSLLTKQGIDIKKYSNEIAKIISHDSDNVLIYKEIVDKIILHNDRILIVYLHHIPFGIRFKYSTSGKMETYRVIIESMEIE